MADFCKQCSTELFGEDMKDFAGVCKKGEIVHVICEGCGYKRIKSDADDM